MRLFLTLALVILAAAARACSCVDYYVPLENAICGAPEQEQLVLEVVLRGRGGGSSVTAEIKRVVVGTTGRSELLLRNGDSGMCGQSLDGYRRGDRFLLFVQQDALEAGETNLFACGSRMSAYPMSTDGRRVAYYGPNPSGTGSDGRLTYRPFRADVFAGGCDPANPPTLPESSIMSVQITNTPGDGHVRLYAAPGSPFPLLRQLQAYRADGRLVTTLDLLTYREGEPLDLSSLPTGYYYLYLNDGRRRTALPYVKTR